MASDDYYRGRVHFPGIIAPISATYTLNHGTDAGRIMLQCNPQPNVAFQNGPFTLQWQSTIVRIPDCRILSDRVTLNEGGFVTAVEMEDYRWKWRYPVIDGWYNVRNAYQSIYAKTKKTPQQLAKLLLDALGIPRSMQNVAALPNDDYPTIEWYSANVANELSALAERYGCRVVPWPDGRVNIFRVGIGEKLPYKLDMQCDTMGVVSPSGPDRIEVHFGPTKYRVICRLEPVGLDVDGSIKPVDELSYKPRAGWANEEPGSLNVLVDSLGTDRLTGPRRFIMDIARRSLFRWYRIKLQMPNGSEFKIPGYSKKVESIAQLLPIDDRVMNVSLDPTKPAELKDGSQDTDQFWDSYDQTMVWGIFFRGAMPGMGVQPVFPDIHAFRKKEGENFYFPGGYTIDRERGIVQFDDVVYSLEWNGSAWGRRTWPTLALSFMASPRDIETGELPKEKVGRDRTDITRSGTKPLVLIHPEFQLVKKFDITTNGSIGPVTDINKKTLDKVGNYYIDAELRKYIKQNPRTITYNGLWPIFTNGAIREVTFVMTPDSGMETTGSYNDEKNPYVLPYETRRRNQRVDRQIKTDEFAPPVFTSQPQSFPYNLGSVYINVQPSRR